MRIKYTAPIGLSIIFLLIAAYVSLSFTDGAPHTFAEEAEPGPASLHDGHDETGVKESAADAHEHEDETGAVHGEHLDTHDDESAGHAEDAHSGEVDGHAGHTDEAAALRLTPEQRNRFGIVIRVAGPGNLQNEVSLPGEIVFNKDRVAHLVPRVAGIVREVTKTVGQHVAADEVLAVIDSRELAEAKAEYLAARERCALAQANFEREKALWEQEISAEREYLDARQALAESRIAQNSAEQKLHALGLSQIHLEEFRQHPDAGFTRYEIRAPFSGTILEKHITLGEALKNDADAFTIADTSSVWVNLTVYTKNLASVHAGQEVVLQVEHSGAQARGVVTMVTPFVEESTRSATARIVLDNSDGRWMPGTFVTGFIRISEDNLSVVVPRDAVQTIEGREVVFIEDQDGLEMAPVTLGRADRTHVEIVAGLEPGARYVADGAYQLKATAITSQLGSHAGHGH